MTEISNNGHASINLDEVLALAKIGLRIHPLQSRNKIPVLQSWQERASSEEGTIRLWHTQYKGANFGVATGEASGVFVLDVDPKSGGDQSLAFLLDENQLPQTWEVRTGSGGTHYYFAYPKGKDIRNSSNKIGRGLDIRANGGQCVIPPSIHPNNTPYTWINHPSTTKLAKAPAWLLDLITDESTEEFTPLGGMLEKGSRNNSIYHNSLALARQGADKDFAMSSILKWLRDQGQNDVDEGEVLKTLNSAYEAAEKKPVDVSDRSDTMNARLLVSTFGEDLIYVSGIGWHFWNGKVWEPDPEDAKVTNLFISTMTALQENAASEIASAKSKTAMKEAGAMASWAVRSLSASAIKNALGIAEKLESVRHHVDEIDGVKTQWLLNCQNGTLDLKTGKLRPHNRADMITKMVPVDYDPDAKAPFWESSLDLVFDGNKHLIDYIQRALGYSITGTQDERAFFICWGESGANGKSTVLETIQNLLGSGYAQMSDMVVITSSTVDNRVSSSLAKLQGARFVSMNEAEENQKLSESLIKQLTGGDHVQGCYKYKNPFEFVPEFKLWIRTNEKPIIRSQTNAIWDRVKLIPFDRPIPKDLRLPRSEVDQRLRAEYSGILAWIVQGCQLWQKDKSLIDPPEVTAAVSGYRVESNLVKAFADECIIKKANNRLKGQIAYQAFSFWCRNSGEKYIMTKTKFTRRMKALGYETDSDRIGLDFMGIGLTPEASNWM